jgi:hypothetical protein
MVGVTGSIPVPPTIFSIKSNKLFLVLTLLRRNKVKTWRKLGGRISIGLVSSVFEDAISPPSRREFNAKKWHDFARAKQRSDWAIPGWPEALRRRDYAFFRA